MHIKLILSTTLLWSLTSFAAATAGYVPPASQEPPSDYSRSTGIRSGCLNQDESDTLIILAPQSYVGETISARPQFIWLMSIPSEIEFRLFEFTANGQVKQKGKPILLKSTAGINTLSLPNEQPSLTVGNKYLWQVAQRCPNGNNILERAEFKVVARPSSFNPNLNPKEKIEQYAQKGFWYDALSESLLVSSSGKLGELGSHLISSLAQSENPSDTSTLSNNQQIIILKRIESLEEISSNWR
ncbi:hypothetical protein C7H19_15050 [Aphanothece hegewaldii CCALA 016]|uniref:DUF928 domain-containing protein n=1 Tax=Aphanothece hegewaldii CCALA 016 TaxID=2107694 RepID=A0A2T1LW24_9CHRO|nr:DUF928 domain-containing protein [Aphanothece hegewaldii]PSF36057.1 hypothetical protein C7H19_15050 [Aphanothece hegewaldii CCALA 016]